MDKTITTPYQVIARRYRPTKLTELVGQQVLAKIISNAIRNNRIAHAFLLTGIRGVGKTTTARLIAKLINCQQLNLDQELIDPCDNCPNCQAASKNNHPDVIEMDAASRTGINDVREIIDNSYYLPILGKYKVYIIDEVHMLSNNAFNGLLKILEEPPAAVKFIFATTELAKIPLTIISRCQKFDLKRINDHELSKYLIQLAKIENISIDPEAIQLIIDNSDGSLRDSLSLLEQAINYSDPNQNIIQIQPAVIEQILGITSQSQIIELFSAITSANSVEGLNKLNEFYLAGASIRLILEGILTIINLISKIIINPDLIISKIANELVINQLKSFAAKLNIPYLTSLWQIINNDLELINQSNNQLRNAEILIIKICYLANLPPTVDLLKNFYYKPTDQTKSSIISEPLNDSQDFKALLSIDSTSGLSSTSEASLKPSISDNNISKFDLIQIATFDQLVELLLVKSELLLHYYLTEEVRLIKFSSGKLELKLGPDTPRDLPNQLAKLLFNWTNKAWLVIVSNQEAMPTIKEQKSIIALKNKEILIKDPDIKAVLENFPGADIIEINSYNLQINDQKKDIINECKSIDEASTNDAKKNARDATKNG